MEENKEKLYLIKFLSEEDVIRALAVDPAGMAFVNMTIGFGAPIDLSHFFYIVVEETLANLDMSDIKYKKLDISLIRDLDSLIKIIESEFEDELKKDARAHQEFKTYRIYINFMSTI